MGKSMTTTTVGIVCNHLNSLRISHSATGRCLQLELALWRNSAAAGEIQGELLRIPTAAGEVVGLMPAGSTWRQRNLS